MKGICTWAAALLSCSSLVARDASGANAVKAGLLLDRAKEICALSTELKKLATDMEAWQPRIVTRDSRRIGDAVDERGEIDRKMDAALAAYDAAMQRIPQERRGSNDLARAHTMVRRLTFLRQENLTQEIAKQTCKTAAEVARGLAAQIDDFINVFGSYTTSSSNGGCIPSVSSEQDGKTAQDAECVAYTKDGKFSRSHTRNTEHCTEKVRQLVGQGRQRRHFLRRWRDPVLLSHRRPRVPHSSEISAARRAAGRRPLDNQRRQQR
ncbi:putative Trypanosome variant surface glycoprotein (A type) [Trypanosoma vivax]|nr:putative Trypanosome variant surface glycoprotein (A type) [Trypanosoma vivax]